MCAPTISASGPPLIRPSQLFKHLRVEPRALVVFSPSQLRDVISCVPLVPNSTQSLGFSTLQSAERQGRRFTLAGPALGAPHAAMLMEVLIAFGARQLIGFGSCGSLTKAMRIGDVLIPEQALSDEGTSAHYPLRRRARTATTGIIRALRQAWSRHDRRYAVGKIWTTDAPFRETPEKMAKFQAKGAVAVDMEVSAFFQVGRFYQVEIGAVLVVSDELFALRWKRGYNSAVFKRSFREATEMVCDFLCQGAEP